MDVAELFRQFIRWKPRNLCGLLIADLRLTRDVAAAEAHRDELAPFTVRIDHIRICCEECKPLGVGCDASFFQQLPEGRSSRLLEGFDDPGGQAPSPCVSAPRQEQMNSARLQVSSDHDRGYAGQQ